MSPAAAPLFDDTLDEASRRWIVRLSSQGREREEASAELHGLLLKAARFTLLKRRSAVLERRELLEDLAMEAADEALLAVLAHLEDFRGESRFTTWAWKFAVVQASVAMRRRDWATRELPAEDEAWAAFATGGGGGQSRLEQSEVLQGLGEAIQSTLSAHQREVFVAIALNEVPIDVLAERLGSTRGAVYKTLHDARQRLRSYLSERQLVPDGWGRRGA